MPSREIRRALDKKKKTENLTKEEKKRKNQPLLYLFSLVILIVIVVTFIGLPVASKVGRGQHVVFGTYDGKEIDFRQGNYFSRQTQIISDQYAKSGEKIDTRTKAFQIWREAFNRTVVHVGILDTVEKSGLHVSEDLIDVRLTEYGPYMENGVFSEEKYNATSNAEKFATRQLFSESIKEEQFRNDFFDNQKSSDEETQFIKGMASPERNFQYVAFSFDDYPQANVVSFGKGNEKLFRKIRLSRITINTSEADAKTIHAQLKENPASFDETAKTQSSDIYADKGGEIGWTSYYQLQKDFPDEASLEAVFSLKAGDISKIVKSKSIWVIYRCDSPAVKPDFTDEETIKTVRSYMERYEAGKIEDYLVTEANQFITKAKENSFSTESSKEGLPLDVTDFFPINYGNSMFLKPIQSMTKSDVLSTAAYNQNFFIKAFKLKKDEISEPIVLDKNVVVLQMLGERNIPEEQANQLDYYYPYILRQFRENELQSYFLTSDKLQDNFAEVFAKHF